MVVTLKEINSNKNYIPYMLKLKNRPHYIPYMLKLKKRPVNLLNLPNVMIDGVTFTPKNYILMLLLLYWTGLYGMILSFGWMYYHIDKIHHLHRLHFGLNRRATQPSNNGR